MYPDGTKVFRCVGPVTDYYKGPFIKNAPDILTIMETGGPLLSLSSNRMYLNYYNSTYGSHHRDGIFIYFDSKHNYGGNRISGINVMDIAPSILYNFQTPIPREMDGHVIPVLVESPNDIEFSKESIYRVDEEKHKISKAISLLKL